MSLLKNLIISVFNNPFVRNIKNIPSVKSFAFRYVGEENIDNFLDKAKEIIDSGYKITLSFLGEHYSDKEDVEKYKNGLIHIIDKVSNLINNNYSNLNFPVISISVKLTGLGLEIDYEYCKENLKQILDSSLRIHIDMEDSRFVDNTLSLFEYYRNEKKYNNLDITFQAYLYRTSKDIEDKLLKFNWQTKPIVRLCKGAYKEPFDKIFPSKKSIDENYYNISIKMLDNIDKIYPAFATHDIKLIEKIKNYCNYRGISRDNFEFQMLYGVRTDIQKKIIEQGYNLRLYIPLGSDWYEYFVRRVAEKPSTLFLVLYSIFMK